MASFFIYNIMAFTYIIYSSYLNNFYVGATQINLDKRIENHNCAKYGATHFTSNAKDWTLFLFFETQDFSHAVRIERKIKKMKSRKFIENLKKYKELREKVFTETL